MPKRSMTDSKVNPGNDIELQLSQPQEQSKTEPIVYIRNAYKYYGIKQKPLVVLDGLNMAVSKGIIYGLLGASGCGKTTLLSCILGLKKLNSGEVCVFGATPGTEGSGVPGLRVGYMPQETALYGDFSIRESFEYFGKIAKIDRKQIKEQLQKLTKLLMLPKANQRVNTLSGGEQRRVSFAIVLLHEPELLILDEPTVGLDPILREDIWNHLVKTCKENGTAIIMTTHYIEEARQSHMVALMRGGRLLAEDSPTNLLAYYGAVNLEEVFLTLSIKQSEDRAGFGAIKEENFPSTSSASLKKTDRLEDMGSSMSPLSNYKASTTKGYNLLSMKGHHLKALLWKNALWWKRNVPTLTFALWISILVVSLGCLCIGSDPRDLSVAVINYETNNSLNCSSLTCSSPHISCHYFEYLKNQSINLVYHTAEDEVKQSVLQGNTYASIVIRHNYTDALRSRINNWKDSEPWDIEYSNIDVIRDVSNYQINTYLERRLYEALRNFFKDYLQACDLSPKVLDIPINWKVPVFGILNPSIMDAVFPGTLLAMMFILAVILTSLVVLVDRNEATFERTLAMGITTTEIIVTHVISEFLITVAQACLSVFTVFTFFNVVHEGSTVLVLLLTMLMGFCGVCFGVLISSVCDTIMAVNLMTLGTCIPTLFLCGSVWPVEAIHYLLRPVAVILPITRGLYSIKSILQKDWDLYSSDVYMGFVYVFLWAAIFLALSIIILKFKKN